MTEYRQQTLTCLACGAQTQAACPPEMPPGSFGPRVQATVGYLTGRIGASQRDVEEILQTVFHLDLGLGSIPAQEDLVSAALAEPVQAAQTYVQQQPVQNVDETGWREKTKRTWLWINTTPLVTFFMIIATRGAKGAQKMLGTVVKSIVGSDRWSGYSWLDPQQRQVCWAHLKRDFQALVERGGESERIGRALLEQVKKLFDLWHRVREGALSRIDFQTAMQPIQTRVGDLLREGAALACDKTRHTCENLLKLEVALRHAQGTFVRVEGVEPTNNSAALRHTQGWVATGRAVASAQFWHPERRWQPLRRARFDGRHDPAPTKSGCAGLFDRGVRGCGARRSGSVATAEGFDHPKRCCSLRDQLNGYVILKPTFAVAPLLTR